MQRYNASQNFCNAPMTGVVIASEGGLPPLVNGGLVVYNNIMHWCDGTMWYPMSTGLIPTAPGINVTYRHSIEGFVFDTSTLQYQPITVGGADYFGDGAFMEQNLHEPKLTSTDRFRPDLLIRVDGYFPVSIIPNVGDLDMRIRFHLVIEYANPANNQYIELDRYNFVRVQNSIESDPFMANLPSQTLDYEGYDESVRIAMHGHTVFPFYRSEDCLSVSVCTDISYGGNAPLVRILDRGYVDWHVYMLI